MSCHTNGYPQQLTSIDITVNVGYVKCTLKAPATAMSVWIIHQTLDIINIDLIDNSPDFQCSQSEKLVANNFDNNYGERDQTFMGRKFARKYQRRPHLRPLQEVCIAMDLILGIVFNAIQ